MKSLASVLTILVGALMATGVAHATYIDIAASDAGATYAVRRVWDDGYGIRMIGVVGDTEITISVSESSPHGITTCWIYIDGTTTTGTTRNFTTSAYREHYGCVVIKYDNDSYEAREFHVKPAWPLNGPEPTTGATPPEFPILPQDSTAANLISPIASADPAGPTGDPVQMCCCYEGGCFAMWSEGEPECSGTCPNCTGDDECDD
jgi:hypothetical protein